VGHEDSQKTRKSNNATARGSKSSKITDHPQKADRNRGERGDGDRSGKVNQNGKTDKVVHKNVNMFTNVDGLTCFYTNADSLLNKLAEFKTIIQNNKPQIIAITELKPKTNRFTLAPVEISIPGYDQFHSNLEPGRDRGCILYVKKELNPNIYPVDSDHTDAAWCEVSLLNNDKLLIGCVYRSPNSTPDDNKKLNTMLEKVLSSAQHSHILLVGDFNFPEINWTTWTAPSENIEDPNNAFIESIRDQYLFQHVDKPTRARINQKSNILDLIFTNEENMISDLEYWSPLGKSDHSLMKFKLNCYISRQSSTQIRFDYNRGNYEEMRKELSDINWEEELSDRKTVEEIWSFIKGNIQIVTDKYIPKRKSAQTTQKKLGILNEKVLAKIRKKHRAWQRYIETKEGQKYEEYCRIRNKVKSLVRKAKIENEQDVAKDAKQNPKKFWQYAKSKTKTKTEIPDLDVPKQAGSNNEAETTHSDGEKAEVFLQYFGSVFIGEGPDNLPNVNRVTASVLEDLDITLEVVKKKLQNINVNKSPGPDGIHPRVLFELRENIAPPLTHLYRQSLQQEALPQDWRDAHISAIFKKGNKRKPNNYRPVSLTSIPCKIIESIIRDHIVSHMKSHKLFSKSQFGFIKGRSTSYQLLQAIDKWTEILDDNGKIDAVYFDFMKAFDQVPHRRLLHKLPSFGISDSLVNWISSFLSNRRQKVVVKGEHSSWSNVTSGIPQGSVLGPLLFVLYINDLPDVVDASILLFADDTKIYKEIITIEDQESIQNNINSMQNWSEQWLLKFHPEKCKVLRLGRNDEVKFPYALNGHDLIHVEEEKDLGVTIDSKLKFTTHISNKVNTANKIMGIIRRTFTYLDQTIFTRLFKAMVRPHLEYANPVWHPTLKKLKITIENVQRRATKKLQSCTDLSYKERLTKLDLPCLAYRKLRGDMIEVYKMLNDCYDSDINPPLTLKTNRRTRGHSKSLYKERANKETRKQFFRNRVVNFWNDLPETVVTAPSTKSFENRLDKYWQKFGIKYDFDKCIDFEKQTGIQVQVQARELNNDLETQE
jgi:hypothetical protein